MPEIVERLIEPDITVVELSGALALGHEAQRIESLIEDLVRKGSRRIVLDMSGVDHIDSAGIGMVALASGKLREAGGKLTVVAPEGRVLQLLKQTQMTTIVKVAASVSAALESV